jgi:ABC-type Fe3+/spermidine/putrescine transport system ATPase subunit
MSRFGADGVLRDTLRQELAQVQARWGIPVLLVTHDRRMSLRRQRVVVYDAGHVIQQGTRDEVFFLSRIAVAEFVRTGNICRRWWIARGRGPRLRWQGYAIAADHNCWRRGRRSIFVSVRRRCRCTPRAAVGAAA